MLERSVASSDWLSMTHALIIYTLKRTVFCLDIWPFAQAPLFFRNDIVEEYVGTSHRNKYGRSRAVAFSYAADDKSIDGRSFGTIGRLFFALYNYAWRHDRAVMGGVVYFSGGRPSADR